MQKAQRQKTKWIVSDVPQAPRVPRKHEPLIGSSTPGPFQGHLLYPFIIIFYPSCIFVQHWHCLTQCGDADRKRGLRLPAYPSIVFQVFSGIYWSLRIWNGIWWLLMQRAKVLCDVSQPRSSGRRDVHLPAAGSQGYGLGSGGSGGISRLQASMQSISVPVISSLFFLFCVKLRLKAMMCGHETLKPLPVSLWVCQRNVAPKWPRLLCIRLSYLRRKYVLSKSTMNIIIPDQTHRFVLLISIMWTQASTL